MKKSSRRSDWQNFLITDKTGKAFLKCVLDKGYWNEKPFDLSNDIELRAFAGILLILYYLL